MVYTVRVISICFLKRVMCYQILPVRKPEASTLRDLVIEDFIVQYTSLFLLLDLKKTADFVQNQNL